MQAFYDQLITSCVLQMRRLALPCDFVWGSPCFGTSVYMLVPGLCHRKSWPLVPSHFWSSFASFDGEWHSLFKRAFQSVDISVALEPLGMGREEGKRPDRATLVPWTQGHYLVWDFTCPDTLVPSCTFFNLKLPLKGVNGVRSGNSQEDQISGPRIF